MAENFVAVDDRQELEQLFARSHEGPVLVFKHSLTCPVSAAAHAEMGRVDREVALVVVQRARDISREVETRTGVRHESPQAILLRDGRAVWSASHWGVTADAVGEALAMAGGQGAGAGGRA
jgi:bacillithiol system protein YtxJ